MKIEISHDLLARKIYERASTEDKMRLKISTFVRARYNDYLERKQLLITSDLNYIEPYETDLEKIFAHENIEILDFINLSKRRKKLWRIASIIALTLFILTGFVVTGTIFKYWRSAEDGWQTTLVLNVKLQDTIQELNSERMRRAAVLDSLGVSKGQLTAREEALLHVRDSLSKSMKSLKQAYEELDQAKKQIEEQSKRQLAEANQKTARLENDKRKIETEKISVQKDNEKITIDYANDLAKRAEEQLKMGKKEEAFRLAAQSYELVPNIGSAQNVLKKIHDLENNGNFNDKNMPIPNIIKKYTSRFNYKPRLKR